MNKKDIHQSLQKCPVCDGTGLVSRPPETAGDVPLAKNAGGPFDCRACAGKGYINTKQSSDSGFKKYGTVKK